MKEYPVINHTLIVGRPGSYKDVTAVKFCSDAQKVGTPIFSNITLSFPHCRLKRLSELRDLRGDVWNPGILYVHDAGAVFNSRQWAEQKKKSVTDARKVAVNNWRKRGLEFLGTVHREMEIDIDIRRMIQYFLYPYVVRDGSGLTENYVVGFEVFDEPLEDRGHDAVPVSEHRFVRPDKYMLMYDTLEENDGFLSDVSSSL